MILHKYKITFIVPSTQVDPNMEAFFNQEKDIHSAKGLILYGIKHGKDTDYSSEMEVFMTTAPAPPPEPPKTPEEQVKNLQIKEKVK